MTRHTADIVAALKSNGGNLAVAAAAEIERLESRLAQRTQASHNHQFAEIADMWVTLPEWLADAPYAQSPETLRKHALIATGHCDVAIIDAGSKAAAERVAASMAPMATRAHGYAIVKADGPLVRVFTPHSQSYRAMGKERFNASKSDCLDWIGAKLQEQAA